MTKIKPQTSFKRLLRAFAAMGIDTGNPTKQLGTTILTSITRTTYHVCINRWEHPDSFTYAMPLKSINFVPANPKSTRVMTTVVKLIGNCIDTQLAPYTDDFVSPFPFDRSCMLREFPTPEEAVKHFEDYFNSLKL